MKCGWDCGAELAAQCARTSPYARSGRQAQSTWTGEGGTRKPSAAAHRGRERRAPGAAAPDSREGKARSAQPGREVGWPGEDDAPPSVVRRPRAISRDTWNYKYTETNDETPTN